METFNRKCTEQLKEYRIWEENRRIGKKTEETEAKAEKEEEQEQEEKSVLLLPKTELELSHFCLLFFLTDQ